MRASVSRYKNRSDADTNLERGGENVTGFAAYTSDDQVHGACVLLKLSFFLMAISAELLEILVCPVCRAKLDLKPDGSGLRCTQCHRLYPIRDEIPVMLIDQATIDE